MRFDDLPVLFMNLQRTYTIILTVVLLCVISVSVRMRRGFVSYLLTGALILGTYFMYQIFTLLMRVKMGIKEDVPQMMIFHYVPEWEWLVLLGVITFLAVLIDIDVRSYRSGKLSSHSVKFATDALPTGLCIYDRGGRILMMNDVMAKISAELTGMYVLSGSLLWERITSRGSTLKLENGQIYSFRLKDMTVADMDCTAITAENVTETYLLAEKLREADEQLNIKQKKLKKLNILIAETTIQKELLEEKTKIHDRFGSTLIATRRFIQGVSDNDEKQIIKMWLKDLDLLKSAAEPEQKDPYDKVFTVAGYVGVDIRVDGELADEKPASDILVTAMIECLTNTFRHAKGDILFVDCREDKDSFIFVLKNNGEPPVNEITETGGLKNLRQAVEHVGGKMDTQSQPEFRLTIEVPKGVDMDAL